MNTVLSNVLTNLHHITVMAMNLLFPDVFHCHQCNMNTVFIKCIDESASYYTDDNEKRLERGDSGYDLYVAKTVTIEPFQSVILPLGIMAKTDYEGGYFVVARSSIWKTPLAMANSIGIIDSGYRGQIGAPVYNRTMEPYTIEAGTRMFQLCLPHLKPFMVEFVDDLDETIRGEGGFGSTGTK